MSQTYPLDPADMGKVPFLQDLLPTEVEALCAAGELRTFKEGEVVFRQGDPGKELYVIIEGEIAIEMSVGGGEARLLAALMSGTIFGEINFLVGSRRTASARALRDTRVLVFRRDSLDQLEGIGRQAATNMMETIARVLALRLSNMNRELAELCETVSRSHPEVSDIIRQSEERRQQLLHEWQF
jgi:CRP-like cAMP-binding protein